MSVVVPALVVASCASCRKTEAERRATVEAEEKASQTTITSGEVEARDGQDETLREQAETIVDARNEQLEYRGKLERALDELDSKRREAKKHGAPHVKVVDARRDVLKHHLEALDRATDGEWPALKAKIDRDLKEQSAEKEGK